MEADFHIETTLSGTSEIKFTQKAKENGYQITMIYLCVADLQIAKKRVASRVRLGGGDVSSDIMERRFDKSYANIPKWLKSAMKFIFMTIMFLWQISKTSPQANRHYAK